MKEYLQNKQINLKNTLQKIKINPNLIHCLQIFKNNPLIRSSESLYHMSQA